MEHLHMQEWQTLSSLLTTLYQLPPPNPFPVHVLHWLPQWVPLDQATYITWVAGKACLQANLGADVAQQERAAQLVQQYMQGQLIAVAGPIVVLEPDLLLPLPLKPDSPSSEQSILVLSRQSRSFDPDEQLQLQMLWPHLCQAAQNWFAYCQRLQPFPLAKSADGVAITSSDSVSLLQTLGLTTRQAEVMQLVAQGKDNQTVAAILGCSAQTVKKHLEGIYDRLEVTTRAAAISVALERAGFVQMNGCK